MEAFKFESLLSETGWGLHENQPAGDPWRNPGVFVKKAGIGKNIKTGMDIDYL